jgi:hypothetical protein
VSLPFIPSFVALVQQRQALPAGHRGAVIRGDPFHFGPMSSFFVARIAQKHPVVIKAVQVTLPSSVSGH